MRRTPYLLRGQDPDVEALGRWRTGRVVLVGACGLGLAAILANAIANPVDPPKEKTTSWAPKSLAAYTLRPERRPEAQPEPEPEFPPAHEDPLPLSSAATPVQQTPPEALLAAATESIGVWFGRSIEDASGTAAVDTAAPAVAGGEARGCLIAAGTVVSAQLVTAASSDHGGAPSSPGSPATCSGADGCLGSEAGSTLVGEMGSARDFGQKRGEVMLEALHTLDGRQVDLDPAAAGDALGMGGVPGEANLDTGAKALRVAIAVDLGAAYLGGRGDGLSILLGHGGRAIDEWARQDACSRQASSGTTTSRS